MKRLKCIQRVECGQIKWTWKICNKKLLKRVSERKTIAQNWKKENETDNDIGFGNIAQWRMKAWCGWRAQEEIYIQLFICIMEDKSYCRITIKFNIGIVGKGWNYFEGYAVFEETFVMM